MNYKKVLCEVIQVEKNLFDYSDSFFDEIDIPGVGSFQIFDLNYFHSFNAGSHWVKSVFPQNSDGRYLYRVTLKQVSVIEI